MSQSLLIIAVLKNSVLKLSVLLRVSENWNLTEIAEGDLKDIIVRLMSCNIKV